jgi:hypothetical protein
LISRLLQENRADKAGWARIAILIAPALLGNRCDHRIAIGKPLVAAITAKNPFPSFGTISSPGVPSREEVSTTVKRLTWGNLGPMLMLGNGKKDAIAWSPPLQHTGSNRENIDE